LLGDCLSNAITDDDIFHMICPDKKMMDVTMMESRFYINMVSVNVSEEQSFLNSVNIKGAREGVREP